jgi:D-glycero-D-manno-heptose 1,7-bisphosphate phosphatase
MIRSTHPQLEAAVMKLLILDRDGVINEDSDAYIKSVAEWIPIPGSVEAIARLSQAGWTVAVATNQSGLARGYYDEAPLDAMHARLR